MITVVQLETDAAAAAEATVHVARFATSTGVGGNASTTGATRAASKTFERRLLSILEFLERFCVEATEPGLGSDPLIPGDSLFSRPRRSQTLHYPLGRYQM